MKKVISFFAGLALAVITTSDAFAQSTDIDLIKRGEYLSIAGDCTACHSNPDDKNPYSGGFPVKSPLGTIYGANITPSKSNGIGNYTLDDFSNAVRYGKAPAGKYLFPAMPYTEFAGMSDDDIEALYTYFMKGVAPVDHQVQNTDLGFPFIRPAMIGWNMLFLDKDKIDGADRQATPIARGEYLVKTLGHCSTCHTPRNAFAGEDMGKFLSGGHVGAWLAPNITPDNDSGIGTWSEDEIFTYLKTGRLISKGAYANGDMGLAVQNSFSKLAESDLKAIAAYLKTVKPVNNAQPVANQPTTTLEASLVEPGHEADFNTSFSLDTMTGAQIYNGACATCHGATGEGNSSGSHAFPTLIGSSALATKDPSNLIMTIVEGVNRTTNDGHVFMPAFNDQFNESELTKVADYVSTTFGSPDRKVTQAQVSEALSGGPKPGFLLENAKALSILGIVIGLIILIGIIRLVFRRKRTA